MSLINATQKLKEEDFLEQKSWIGAMFYIVNRFIQQTVAVVNGNIEFGVNIKGLEHDFVFNFSDSEKSFPQKVLWPFTAKAKAFVCVSATEDGTSIVCLPRFGQSQDSSGAFIQLIEAVKIDGIGISPLSLGSNYVIRVRITP